MLPIVVRDNNVEKALRTLKRMCQRSGLNKEVRKRRAFIRPCEKRQQKIAEARRRMAKNKHRRQVKEGY